MGFLISLSLIEVKNEFFLISKKTKNLPMEIFLGE